MKNFSYTIFVVFVFGFLSCQPKQQDDSQEEQSIEDLQNEMDRLQEDIAPTDLGDWHTFFDLKIPAPMQEMTELNKDAIAQYSYVEEVELEGGKTEVREHYLIVMMEEKADIKGYPVELKVDLKSYNEDAIETLRKGEKIENFTVLTQSPEIEKTNGAELIKSEIEATFETYDASVELYYQLGVFETERAFYQVLTWCIGSQRDLFKTDMERIIGSFREK